MDNNALRPHILHVINGLSRGGTETALLRHIEDTLGIYRHTIISLTSLDQMRGEFEALAGVSVFLLRANRGVPDPRLLFRCTRLIRLLKPDLVHAWLPLSWLISTVACRFACGVHIPLVWSARSLIMGTKHRFSEVIALRLCRAMSGQCDALVANSHVALCQLNQYGFRPKSSYVVHNGVSITSENDLLQLRYRVRFVNKIADSDFVILFLGRIHPDKGISLLLDTINYVAGQLPEAIFWRVGRAASVRDQSLDTARVEKSQLIHHFGEIADPTPYLAAADALVLTSQRESCPNAIIEAMAAGLPVVATDVGDVRIILGDAGLVGTNSSQSIGNHLLNIARGGFALRSKMGKCGRNQAAQKHSRENVASRYIDIYQLAFRTA